MILEIRLSNFGSIKDEVVLDLRAGNLNTQKAKDLQYNTFDYKNDKILKAVAIYGANASGKSFVVDTIGFCRIMVLHSHENNADYTFSFMPFKFDGYSQKPTYFFIRFVLEEIEYEYSFSFNRTEIIEEELYYYPNGRKKKIFTRDENNGKNKSEIYNFGSVISRPMDIAENTSRKTLFISRASQMGREIAIRIFNFFALNVNLGIPDANIPKRVLDELFDENKETLIKALKIADSDIVDIIREEEKYKTFHKLDKKVFFDLSEESTGTQKLFLIILDIIGIIKNDGVLIVDEIETHLHTKIVEYILKFFYAGKSAQIIYTTHNTKLLDLDKMRKDQIYFVNKKKDGSSDLYSLFDYKDFRENMDLEKAYLQGRFDAVPFVDDSIENLREMLYGEE